MLTNEKLAELRAIAKRRLPTAEEATLAQRCEPIAWPELHAYVALSALPDLLAAYDGATSGRYDQVVRLERLCDVQAERIKELEETTQYVPCSACGCLVPASATKAVLGGRIAVDLAVNCGCRFKAEIVEQAERIESFRAEVKDAKETEASACANISILHEEKEAMQAEIDRLRARLDQAGRAERAWAIMERDDFVRIPRYTHDVSGRKKWNYYGREAYNPIDAVLGPETAQAKPASEPLPDPATVEVARQQAREGKGTTIDTIIRKLDPAISFRDWLAGMAMQALINFPLGLNWDVAQTADVAYSQADAMIAEREKRQIADKTLPAVSPPSDPPEPAPQPDDRIFSGSKSDKLWISIACIREGDEHDAIYELGCAIQKFEAWTRKTFAELRAATPPPPLPTAGEACGCLSLDDPNCCRAEKCPGGTQCTQHKGHTTNHVACHGNGKSYEGHADPANHNYFTWPNTGPAGAPSPPPTAGEACGCLNLDDPNCCLDEKVPGGIRCTQHKGHTTNHVACHGTGRGVPTDDAAASHKIATWPNTGPAGKEGA